MAPAIWASYSVSSGVTPSVLVILLTGTFYSDQGTGVWTTNEALEHMMGPLPAEAKEAVSPAASPYDIDVKPLTTAECAQCHYSVFETMKTAGGKHQIDVESGVSLDHQITKSLLCTNPFADHRPDGRH